MHTTPHLTTDMCTTQYGQREATRTVASFYVFWTTRKMRAATITNTGSFMATIATDRIEAARIAPCRHCR